MKAHFVSFHNNPEAYLDDASFRYRCENLAFALNQVGIRSELQHFKSFKLSTNTTHVVFHRPRYSPRLKRLIRRLQRLNIVTIADFDDLVFDESFSQFSPAILNNILPLKKVATKYRRHFQAIQLFENIHTSTETLSRYAKRLLPNAKITLIHNVTHHNWPQEHSFNNTKPEKRTITYFPGTRSHDRDFWQIEDAIAIFLDNHPSVELLVIGPLNSTLLERKNTQIRHIQRLPFEEYTRAVATTWVNLLPLEATPFNQCKSALKVIEAASYGAPTICSPLPDALRFEDSGAITAINQSQWLKHLESLLDPVFYGETVDNINRKFSATSQLSLMAKQFCNAYEINID